MPGKTCRGIKNLYRKKGVKPPEGKGIHTRKFHEMVSSMEGKRGYSRQRAASIAMSKLGRAGAVRKSHRDPRYRKPK